MPNHDLAAWERERDERMEQCQQPRLEHVSAALECPLVSDAAAVRNRSDAGRMSTADQAQNAATTPNGAKHAQYG